MKSLIEREATQITREWRDVIDASPVRSFLLAKRPYYLALAVQRDIATERTGKPTNLHSIWEAIWEPLPWEQEETES